MEPQVASACLSFSFCETKLLSGPIAGMGKAIKALETVPPFSRKISVFQNIQRFPFWH